MNFICQDQVIQQFGGATLVRHRNGSCELIGGSIADRVEAAEWVSLFAHEIVFNHLPVSTIVNRVSPQREKYGPLLSSIYL